MQKAESSPDLTRKRYNRIAFLYDLMEAPHGTIAVFLMAQRYFVENVASSGIK